LEEEAYALIEIRVDELLEGRGQTFYWLAKETGISHSTLWRLKKGRAVGINFSTLERICQILNCQPGDVPRLASDKKKAKKRATRNDRARS
jgi:putative transcriptional regulator